MVNRDFWQGRRVFLTGHTGFKGGWLAAWLNELGADVTGYSLAPNTQPAFFERCGMAARMRSKIGDILDLPLLQREMSASEPEVVLHLAAQPIVRLSYQQPAETIATNVMGTVNALEAARHVPSVRAVVSITSDKCYHNSGWVWGYRENEPMGGRDPYSASKGCAELIAAAYQHSYYRNSAATVATVRAGNVIGGGDWALDRLVPDAARHLAAGKPFPVRNPASVRPWQHVLDPLCGYLMLAEKVYAEQTKWEGGWNFGPADVEAVPVSRLAERIVGSWGDGASWENLSEPGAPHEEAYLKLDSSKAQRFLKWRPRLQVDDAVDWSVAWYKQAQTAPDMYGFTLDQIRRYESLA